MNEMVLIKSNGVELPCISNDLSIQYSDQQVSSITSWKTGETKPNYKRKDIVSLPLTWNTITIEEMELILNNTKSSDEGYTLVEFYDVNQGIRVEKKMVRSNRSVTVKKLKGGVYVDLSFDLSEV